MILACGDGSEVITVSRERGVRAGVGRGAGQIHRNGCSHIDGGRVWPGYFVILCETITLSD